VTGVKATLACLFVLSATPCLWDSDTIDTELRGVPDALDLIVGRWHHHGPAYYQERVRRLGALTTPSLDDLDDLAVAHEHLGDRAAAIAVMGRKAELLAKQPDQEHEYRRLANLGTFLAHDGRYEEALVQLRAAVKLNPAAHFGRETFQIEAIEFVVAAKQRPALWAEQSFLRHAGYHLDGFGRLIVGLQEDADRGLDFDEAYRAIGGMIRFGGREGPELFRSLGELMLTKDHLNLAWWSFRRAIERGHPAADELRRCMQRIEDHWREAARYQAANPIPDEFLFESVRANAEQWCATFRELEAAAIGRGEEVRSDAAVQRLLVAADRKVPRLPQPSAWSIGYWTWQQYAWVFGVAIFVGYVVVRVRQHRARPT
jgi:tetratricopeptide (TPR) repeat protein